MLRSTSLVLLTICINYISMEYGFYSDGWIPVAREQVYDQIQREWAHNFIPTMKPDIDTSTRNTLKLLYLNQNNANDIKIEDPPDSIDSVKQKYTAQVTFENQVKQNNETITTTTESQRKAKKIIDRSFENHIDIDPYTHTREKNDTLDDNGAIKITNIIDRSNTYEVTEDSEVEDLNSSGYEYPSPTTEKQNFSSTLINILSKYNIKTDDKLQNYDLSRQITTQNRLNNIHTVWNPFSYNSQNHLSVDPLLGVFLSNYGFYLPSLYGIKSNYNNLYGYLASNNIHNNRPFGLYKIFSDTDSWN